MSQLRRVLPLLLAVASVAASASPAAAQQPFADVLSFLLTNQAVPTGDFVKDAGSPRSPATRMARLLLVELTTLPLDSSSAGLHLSTQRGARHDRAGQRELRPVLHRARPDRRAGAVAARHDRAGRSRIHQLDRLRPSRRQLLITANQFRDEPQPFDVETLRLALGSTTVTFAGNVGVTDRLDVGVAVPIVRLSLEGIARQHLPRRAVAAGERRGDDDWAG